MNSGPPTATARYDREMGRAAAELANGRTCICPARLAQEPRGPDDEVLSGIVVDGAGFTRIGP